MRSRFGRRVLLGQFGPDELPVIRPQVFARERAFKNFFDLCAMTHGYGTLACTPLMDCDDVHAQQLGDVAQAGRAMVVHGFYEGHAAIIRLNLTT